MTTRSDIPGMTALLCERCGYVLDDLDQAGECPECGIPIASVMPRLRPGSPWQQQRDLGSLIRTWWLLLTRPRSCWDGFGVQLGSGLTLMACGLICAALLPTLLVLGIVLYSGVASEALGMFGYAIMYLAIVFAGFLLVAMLYCALGVARIKFWCRHRGCRMDSNIAWTIIGHASMGLSLIPLMLSVAIVAMIFIRLLYDHSGLDGAELTVAWIILGYSSWIMALAALPTGLIVFEILSSLGLHRMRYRNPHPDEQPDSAA